MTEILNFITENFYTIIIAAVILAAVIIAVMVIIKNKKAGKSSCSFACESCAMKGSCKKKN